MPTFKRAAVAFVAVGALLAAAGGAAADSGTPSPGTARTGDGAQALCKRLPRIEKRIDNVLERMNGTAAERGSIARLEKRVASAKAAGHTEIETFLTHRLAARTSHRTALDQRQKDLVEVKAWCKANIDRAKG